MYLLLQESVVGKRWKGSQLEQSSTLVSLAFTNNVLIRVMFLVSFVYVLIVLVSNVQHGI